MRVIAVIAVLLLAGCTTAPHQATVTESCEILFDGFADTGLAVRVQNIIIRMIDDPDGSTITAEELRAIDDELGAAEPVVADEFVAYIQEQRAVITEIHAVVTEGSARIIDLVAVRELSQTAAAICAGAEVPLPTESQAVPYPRTPKRALRHLPREGGAGRSWRRATGGSPDPGHGRVRSRDYH